MSQPPYPPQGGSDPGGGRSGGRDWSAPGGDDPTRQLDLPGAEEHRHVTQQFDQSGYVPPGPPYGQPTSPQSGQSPYPHYGPPQYPPPQYGQPQYGQPQYGQQPPYGQPWGPPGGPGAPQQRRNRNTVIALVVAAVLVLAVIGVGLVLLLRAGDSTPEATASGGSSSTTDGSSEPAPNGDGGIPAATVTPDGLGNDPDLDEFAQECFAGDMVACDDLYELAEPDSLYALYGGTCAGRQTVSDADTVFCTDAFPGD